MENSIQFKNHRGAPVWLHIRELEAFEKLRNSDAEFYEAVIDDLTKSLTEIISTPDEVFFISSEDKPDTYLFRYILYSPGGAGYIADVCSNDSDNMYLLKWYSLPPSEELNRLRTGKLSFQKMGVN